MKRRLLSTLLAVALAAAAFSGCSSTDTASSAASAANSNGSASGTTSASGAPTGLSTGKLYLTLSGGNSSTDSYTYWVAASKAVQEVCPDLQITVVDATGGLDVAQRLRAGSIDCGNGVTTTDYESYSGTGNFDGKPFKDLRVLWYYTESPLNVCVDASLGLKYVNQLNGVKVTPGGTGSANTVLAMDACKIIGVKPDWFEASSSGGIDAMMNRQISGVIRNGAPQDSQVLQILSAVDVNFLSFTDDEIEKIQKTYPYVLKTTIPSGSYPKQDYDYTTIETCQGGITTTKLTQEQGYAMISAMMSDQGRASWQAAYPKGTKTDIIDLTLKSAKAPLQAGVVQYMVEKGYTVPNELIPPEYVPVSASSK